MDNLPPLEWIRAFEAAARLGSFTRAAAETGHTQSAISQRIANLEAALGAKLFSRQPRQISLTVEGESWLPHVQSALQNLENSREALFGQNRRKITISASQSIIQLWILPRLPALISATDTEISLQTMILEDHAPEDEIIRIRYGDGNWPHFYKQQLYQEEITPLASPIYRETWQMTPQIGLSGPRPDWHVWSASHPIQTTPLPKLRFDTYLAAESAAKSGLGLLLGSIPLSRHAIEKGELTRLTEKTIPHQKTYWLIAGQKALAQHQWEKITSILTA